MSIDTTAARGDLRAAEQAWKAHKRYCPRCTTAARSRQWDTLCRNRQDR